MNNPIVKIVISGVESVNKGAELMLYAILSQIELHYPNAEVYLPISQFPQGLRYIKTSLTLKQSPNKFVRFLGKNHITGVLNRIGLRSNYLNNLYPIKGAKYYFDASGLFFSDQMISSERVAKDLHILLEKYKKQGTKILYLPQAFGPFEKTASHIAVNAALKFSDILIVRDNVSMNYLTKFDISDVNIKQYPDFTSVIEGVVPSEYLFLKGHVCIIPNGQIIRKGIMSKEHYVDLMIKMIETIYDVGHKVFFLDHANDITLINEIIKKIKFDIPVVYGLDALSVKGIIGQSYLCISSRFHGVASAFSTHVPCLTTSWNHKYQELLQLYDMKDSLLSTSDNDAVGKIIQFLDQNVNMEIRNRLKDKNYIVKQSVDEMWKYIWSI